MVFRWEVLINAPHWKSNAYVNYLYKFEKYENQDDLYNNVYEKTWLPPGGHYLLTG